jgi:hypothetical protein
MIRAMTLCAGSAVSALQPPKMLLGTMAIAFIAVVGSVIDAVGGNHYVREHAMVGALDDQDVATARRDTLASYQSNLPAAMQQADDPAGEMTLDELRAALQMRYIEERSGLDEEAQRAQLEEDYREASALLADLEPIGLFGSMMTSAGMALSQFVEGVISCQPIIALEALREIVFTIPATAFRDHPLLTALIGVLLAFSLALFGGAIARLDALDTGLGQKTTAWIGIEYAWAHISIFLQALLLPLFLVAVLAGLAALIGIPFNIPYLDVIGAIIYGIAIIFGIIATVLMIGFGVMCPMLIGAIAVERVDVGDALQRAWGTLFNRPAHVALMLVVALISFAVGLALLDLVAVVSMKFAAESWGGIIQGEALRGAGSIQLLDFTFTQTPDITTGRASAASALLGFWETLVVSIVVGYVFSWFATLGSRFFLAMRYLVDRQSTAVIWVPGAIPGSTVRVPNQPEGAFTADDEYTNGNR